MKKVIAIIMALILFAFPAMAAEDDLAGTWYLHSGIQDGMEIDAGLIANMGMTMTLILNEDGTASLMMNGQESQQGSWDKEASTITFNDNSVPFEIADGKIKFEVNGAAMVFGKDMPEMKTVEITPEVENPQIGDFDGTWNATYYDAMGLNMPLSLMGTEFSLTIKDGSVAYTEKIYDLNNNHELTDTIEHDFTATLGEDGKLSVDFAGEEVLSKVAPGSSAMVLTLHEGGLITATIPEIDEQMKALEEMSAATQNNSAEAAPEAGGDAAQAPVQAEGESSGESAGSSGEMSMSVFFILEKAE